MNQENELIAKAQAGDRDAFGMLYEAYVKKVYDFAYFRIGNKETAEDVTSAIFIKIMKNIAKYDQSKGSFLSWVLKISRNHIIDHYRTKKEAYSLEGEESSDDGAHKKETENAILHDQAMELLKRLKPEHKDIVIMRVWDELSYAEISAVIGKSEAAAKMSFKRAVESLRRIAPNDWLALLSICFLLKNLNI